MFISKTLVYRVVSWLAARVQLQSYMDGVRP